MIEIIPKSDQYNGDLFDGVFHENRPVSFPENGKTNAYSNLFYWAHLEARETGEFGLHPHEGFEIITFILKGELEHFDTKTQIWTPLKAGGVQVIQSGSGVQHAERIKKGTDEFQIWFDPDFSKALAKEPTYKDYQPDAFIEREFEGKKTVVYVGEGGPIETDTEGLGIKKVTFPINGHRFELNPKNIYSMYLIDGEIEFDQNLADKDSYIVIQDMDAVTLNAHKESELFIVETPQRPSYTTYIQTNRNR